MFIRLKKSICNVDIKACSLISVNSNVLPENPTFGLHEIEFTSMNGIVMSKIDFQSMENAVAALNKIQKGIMLDSKIVNISKLE